MLKKIIILGILGLIVVLTVSLSSVFAKDNVQDDSSQDSLLPEKEGIYDVPGKPNLKLRVFVYKPHPARPTPSPSPSLVCGLLDPDSTAIVDPTGWHLPATWTYTLNSSSVPSAVGSANLATMSNDAFNRWSDAISGKVVFSKTSSDTTINRAQYDEQNIIAWGRTSGTALAVTYIWYYPSTGLVAEVDTIMNKKFSWSWSNTPNCAYTNTYDAQDILTHELGHWLGLDDEYTFDYQNNTMYGYGAKTEVKKNTLSTGDETGVNAIYP